MYQVCPTCKKSRLKTERVVEKDGKRWLIEYCEPCGWNFDITELPVAKRRFKFGRDHESDYE